MKVEPANIKVIWCLEAHLKLNNIDIEQTPIDNKYVKN